jgi:hypothetical protein
MTNGDRMTLAEGAHLAGLALLLAFAAAFILSSARAAKPPEGQDLTELFRALMPTGMAGSLPWRELERRLRGRWSEAPPQPRPPGLETVSTVRMVQVPTRTASAGTPRDYWQVLAWGSTQSPHAVSLKYSGAVSDAGDLEQMLANTGVPFVLECETGVARHYRLAGRSGYAAQYGVPGGPQEILLFWQPPPDALLKRDGCLISSARR